MGYFALKSAVRLRGQGSHLNHRDLPNCTDAEAGRTQGLEDLVTETFRQTTQVKRIGIREGQIGESEWRRSAMGLVRQHILPLRSKHGRAPLPLSPASSKGLLRQGVPERSRRSSEYCPPILLLGRWAEVAGRNRVPVGPKAVRPASIVK
jgi:hypothetical protein